MNKCGQGECFTAPIFWLKLGPLVEFCFFSAWCKTQGLRHARQVLLNYIQFQGFFILFLFIIKKDLFEISHQLCWHFSLKLFIFTSAFSLCILQVPKQLKFANTAMDTLFVLQ